MIENQQQIEKRAIELAKQLESAGVIVLVEERKDTIDIYMSTYTSIGCLTLYDGGIWDGTIDIAPASIKAIAKSVGGAKFKQSTGMRRVLYQS